MPGQLLVVLSALVHCFTQPRQDETTDKQVKIWPFSIFFAASPGCIDIVSTKAFAETWQSFESWARDRVELPGMGGRRDRSSAFPSDTGQGPFNGGNESDDQSAIGQAHASASPERVKQTDASSGRRREEEWPLAAMDFARELQAFVFHAQLLRLATGPLPSS